jgi:hypothetical protein
MTRSKYIVCYFLPDNMKLSYNKWFIIIERGTKENEEKASINNNNLLG